MPTLFESVRDTSLGPAVVKAWAAGHAKAYRITNGRIGEQWPFHKHFPKRIPICLLTTVGRKTGQPRTKPTVYLRSGDAIVIAASYGGMAKDPLWLKNIQANPCVEIQTGPTRHSMYAYVANDEERALLWPRLLEVFPGFQDYQESMDRQIPVVVCRPESV